MNEELDYDDLLASDSAAQASPDRRAHLRSQTIRIVHRRRHWRQARFVAWIALAYVAGWGTQSWIRSRPSSPTQDVAAVAPLAPPLTPPARVTADNELKRAVEISELAARQRARAATSTPYVRWRDAGNRQLLDQGDYTTALRFYRKALNAATPQELHTADPMDSWLLAELKYDRLRTQQEPFNVDPSL
jgi:hypothetical protein